MLYAQYTYTGALLYFIDFICSFIHKYFDIKSHCFPNKIKDFFLQKRSHSSIINEYNHLILFIETYNIFIIFIKLSVKGNSFTLLMVILSDSNKEALS